MKLIVTADGPNIIDFHITLHKVYTLYLFINYYSRPLKICLELINANDKEINFQTNTEACCQIIHRIFLQLKGIFEFGDN